MLKINRESASTAEANSPRNIVFRAAQESSAALTITTGGGADTVRGCIREEKKLGIPAECKCR